MSLENLSVELVLSEFGADRQNAGSAELGQFGRLEPALSTFTSVFPNASITLYTDRAWSTPAGIEVRRVASPFDVSHPRFGWRSHDYFQAIGLLESHADVAIALDADIEIVSTEFRVITTLTKIFGLCVPINPRLLLRIDGGLGVDSTYKKENDPTAGLGLTYNLAPIAFDTSHSNARRLLRLYCKYMRECPGRGAVHLVAATYALGFQPHVLGPQWCVSSPRDLDSKHIWNEPIALHVGHAEVASQLKRKRLQSMLRSHFESWLGR